MYCLFAVDVLDRMPVNVRAVVFGSSAAFLLFVLVLVIVSSRRRCRSHASCEPSLPAAFPSSAAGAAVSPARLLSFVYSTHTPPLPPIHEDDVKNSSTVGRTVPTVAAAALRPPIPRRKRMMMRPTDEDADFYATKYDSGSRPPKPTSGEIDNGGRLSSESGEK
jgi:hypothetical protein